MIKQKKKGCGGKKDNAEEFCATCRIIELNQEA